MKICPVCSTEYPDDVKFCPNDGQTLRSGAPANNLVGQVIADRYHVVKKLGEGGMGQVYLAEHVKMGRRSAIKVMTPAMVHDPDAVARFNREASNASRINHPNVCAIYDFGETPDGLIYLAMEFIDGEPLTDLLQRDGALSLPRATAIFLQTADALQAAHDLGIVHRDLKPDNIMLSRRKDGGDVVKVVDFGIAKAVGGDQAGQKVTKTGLVVGTPEFMSPEQLSGDTVDGRSDLYSLALVLFRMLTGKVPFEATSVQTMMVKRLTEEPTKLAEVRPDLSFPAGLQPVLDTALARTPAQRYQAVTKFAADVAAVTGSPTSGGVPHTRSLGDSDKTQLLDPTAGGVTQKISTTKSAPVKKRSLVPVAVGVVVLLGAGGAWVALSGGSKAGGIPADTSRATNVPQNTARNDAGRQSGGITTLSQRDSARRASHPPPARLNLAAADAALTELLDSIESYPNKKVRDSATAFFNAPGISARDKAMAAFVIANTYFQMKERNTGCDWVRRASSIDPSRSMYATLLTNQCN